MSLRKSPTLTPALLAACRGNAQKSTGPRTSQGKAQVRMNALRRGGRSQVLRGFLEAMVYAPLGGVEGVVRRMLTPDLARQEVFATWAQCGIEAELPERERGRRILALCRRPKKRDSLLSCDQSGNVIENTAYSQATPRASGYVDEK
jgi:hypothetical protein